MNNGVIARTFRSLGARDPGRERLRKMLSVTTGILASVLWGYGVVHFLHADTGLLAMSMFLSLMTGAFVKDSSAPARMATTALLIPTVVLVPLAATALDPQRFAQLIVFVLLCGVAVWVRRFGARATTLGTLSFFSYFFTLFMHPTSENLVAFCLIAAGAVSTQLVMALIMWLRRHPERELGMMLDELRVATAAALETAGTPPAHAHALLTRLERVDTMWRAVTDWQQSFLTEMYTDCDAETLALRVMDACVHTEQACHQLAATGAGSSTAGHDPAARAAALAHALDMLAPHTPHDKVEQARDWATRLISDVDSLGQAPTPNAIDLGDYRLAECILAHSRLREVGLHRRHAPAGSGSAEAPESEHSPAPSVEAATQNSSSSPSHHAPRLRWIAPRDWTPTSRLAIQAMTATSIATVVGEAISASRWYWAVLTAFLVFLSTTTRSGILTRAYRRVLGTVLGLVVGVGLAFLAHGVTPALLAICLLCVMGMLYFAPLNYMYASFFITMALVVLYDILGVLHGKLLEVRLEETLAGCICGVVCAYLLLSTNSRPALITKTDAYFDAVDDLLEEGADLAADPARSSGLLPKVHAVESAQADVDQTISAMSTAFLILGRDRVDAARNLMAYATRSSVRFAQVLMSTAAEPSAAPGLARHHDLIRDAITSAQEAAALARRQISQPADAALSTKSAGTAPRDTAPAPVAAETVSPEVGDPAVRSALIALARLSWVMHRLSDVLRPSEEAPRRHLLAHAL